jgi:putative ABC transport system permease protein
MMLFLSNFLEDFLHYFASNSFLNLVLNLVLEALQQTLIFLPITLGIYLTYRIIRITDLTVGGSYGLGAAIFAKLLTSGIPEGLAMIFALFGGLLAGFGVFALQKFAKINALIASILAVFMLFSINFGIMGQPNISLLENLTFLNSLQNLGAMEFDFSLLGLNLILIFGLLALLRSRLGLRLRAYGSNPILLNRLGYRSAFYLALGLMLSNLLAALCGVMSAEINGYADIHMDDGVALTAIGSVVIGCQLMKSLFFRGKLIPIGMELLGCVLGAFIYFLALHLFLSLNLNPIYLKLCLGLLLAVFLSTAHYSRERGVQYEAIGSN